MQEPTIAPNTLTRPMWEGIGTQSAIFFIDIEHRNDRLQVAYMGAEHDTFDLNPYQTDSFYWFLDFNESARRARLPNFPKEYFILEFGCSTSASWGSATGNVEMECLTWKHEFSLAGDGETFRKNETNMRIGVQHLHDDI